MVSQMTKRCKNKNIFKKLCNSYMTITCNQKVFCYTLFCMFFFVNEFMGKKLVETLH